MIKSKKQKKLKYVRLSRVMLILAFSFLTLFIISVNSTYLIKSFFRPVLIILSIWCMFLCGYFIYNYRCIKTKETISNKIWILNILSILYCVACICFLIILYDTKFEDWLITKAMGTMHHQYYCKIFYDDDEINKIMGRNFTEEPNVEMDPNLVKKEEAYDYDVTNKYETNIFKNHKKDELYRMVRFKVNGQDAYLAIIYDPSKISVAYTKTLNRGGEYVVSMAKRTNALIATNGGRFKDVNFKGNGGTPSGVTISKGKIITDRKYRSSYGVIGFNKDDVLVLYKNKNAKEVLDLGVRDCVTSLPFLIVNGQLSGMKGNGGYGYDARTAIGQREDGIVLLLVVDANDTRTNGASMKDLTEIMHNYGAINAAALDGGTSSVMVENGVLISDPITASFRHGTRPVATSIILTR